MVFLGPSRINPKGRNWVGSDIFFPKGKPISL